MLNARIFWSFRSSLTAFSHLSGEHLHRSVATGRKSRARLSRHWRVPVENELVRYPQLYRVGFVHAVRRLTEAARRRRRLLDQPKNIGCAEGGVAAAWKLQYPLLALLRDRVDVAQKVFERIPPRTPPLSRNRDTAR